MEGFSIDVSAISRRFTTTTSLEIMWTPQVTFSDDISIATITTLRLSEVTNLSLQLLASAFPNVEAVAFDEITSDPSDTCNPVWPHLKHLTISGCPAMPWRLLDAVDLTQLSYLDPIDEDVAAFLASHKSLECLDIGYDPNHVYSIATCAPQLRSLAIDCCDELVDRTRMKLNKLAHLGIYEMEGIRLSLQLFEQILHSRFLPKKGRRKSTNTEPTSLEILVDVALSEAPEWQSSELIGSAQREVTRVDRWEKTWTSYVYKWE
jgi:hypothetical protein